VKRLLLATAAVFVLEGTSSAWAFPIVICGAKRCITTENPAVSQVPSTWSTFVPTAPAVAPQPFYAVGWGVPPGENTAGQSGFYVAGPALVRVPGGNHTLASWIRLTRQEAAAYKAATTGLAPYPAPTTLRTVIVDHAKAADPTSYLRLYGFNTQAPAGTKASDWITISFIGDATPWTDGLVTIAVSRHSNVLRREGRIFTIPATVAARARAGRSLGK